MQGSTHVEAPVETDDISATDDPPDRIYAESKLDKRLHLDTGGAFGSLPY